MTAPQRPASNSDARKRAEERTAEEDAPRTEPQRLVCTCYGGPHGGYTCPDCRPVPRVIPPGSSTS